MRVTDQKRTLTRLAAGALALGLVAGACGDADDDPVADQSDDVAEAPIVDEPPETVDEQPVEPPAEGAAPAVAGLPPIDADCADLPDTDDTTRSFDAAPPMCLRDGATYTARMVTSAGTITIDLDQTIAPTTVNSFVFLARNNYFDDTVCHRIIKDFVVQCGDPTATGTGGPGYAFPDELPSPGQYQVGSIAMANSGPNTNGSQFFIITGANGVALPPLYSLFGQVPADDLGVVGAMDSQASLDPSGVPPTTELRIQSVEITQS